MDALEFIKEFNEILWNRFLMYVLLAVGIFYTVYLGFPQIRHLRLAFRYAFRPATGQKETKDKPKVNSFQALATAVAAQVGTGNVGGVATAIAMGGMGAVFWMWVSAFLGMGTIFSEAVLAQKYRKEYKGEIVGGPAYYIHAGLKSKKLAIFYSVAMIVATGFIGTMVQANSISIAVTSAADIKPWVVGIAIALLVGLVIMGGQRRITSIAEFIVPFMAVAYIIGSLIIMFIYSEEIPSVFSGIFTEAFSTKAAAGGAVGTVMKYAIRYGIARGLFSNEAGMGTTPHAHALAEVKDPSVQGFVAMSGVFITLLICTSTALVILLTGVYSDVGLQSVAITQEAFSTTFGQAGIIFLAISLLFFAFTTIIGWYIFGEMNVKYLFGKKGVYPFRAVVLFFAYLGTIFTANLAWELSDTFNGIMIIPNILAILFLAPQVKKAYKGFLKKYKAGEL